MSDLVWKVESAWDEFDNCPGQILYFHKKENAQKCLRKWLTVETKIWEREGLILTAVWPNCKTWEDVVDYLVAQGGDSDVAWIDTIKFEDEGEDEDENCEGKF